MQRSQRSHARSINFHGSVDFASLGDDPLGEIVSFSRCQGPAELNAALSDAVQGDMQAIEQLLQDADAFDVIELMRLREIPPVPVAALRDGFDGSGAIVEILALVLLSRPSRKPDPRSRAETRPHEVVPELHSRAARLLRLATYKLFAEAALHTDQPLARLAAEYQSYVVTVRSMQYASIHDHFNVALFDNDRLSGPMRAVFGFTYPDFDAVRTAVQDFYSEKLTRLRDVTAEIAVESNGGRLPQTEERIAEGRQAFVDFLFLPGQRASFRVEDIVRRTNLDTAVVFAVLKTFSIAFDGTRSSSQVVFDFLRGDNPIARNPLVVDGGGNYVMTSLQIGTDSFRRVVEQGLKPNPRHWKRYDRVRMKVSEELAVSYLATALRTPPTHTGLKYYSPRPGTAPAALDAACDEPAVVAEPTEADALFIVDDVALCLEVKGRSIADPARRGDVTRFARELEQTIGSAASQARRLERLIEANGGLWLEDGTWLDLSAVREVRSVAVGLDDYGPSGTALDELRRSGVIAGEKLPWVTSLHDLATIASVVDRPAELLLYLRRRSDSAVAEVYRASDELDLFMLFLDGGLFVEPDPDEIERRYGGERRPTERDRRRYADSMRPTRVGTFTDPLDAWMYYDEGSSPFPAEKPSFTSDPLVFEIVDFLADQRRPGWFRFAADLLSLSGKTQARLATGIKKLWRKTRADGRPHSLMQSYAGAWGHPAFFAATIPTTADSTAAAESLRRYMSAKKHQLRSDRALGVLYNEQGSIVDVFYANEPYAPSVELDLLVERMKLMPLGRSSRPPWESARTRARRQKRKQKRRRR